MSDYLPHAIEGGQEHFILEDSVEQRYYKITHPDQFGVYPEPVTALDRATQKFVPRFLLRKALPAEYLNRLKLQNELFGDDQRLHGVFVHEGKLRTVTSQSALRGVAPTKQGIFNLMGGLNFDFVRSGGSQFFYRPTDNVAVFDCHEGNFIETADGLLPIDVIAVQPSGGLLEAIRAASA